MSGASPQTAAVLLAGAALVGTAVSLAMMARLARRIRRGLPVLPREPRQPVPWGLADLLLVVVGYLGFTYCGRMLDQAIFGPLPPAPASSDTHAASPPPVPADGGSRNVAVPAGSGKRIGSRGPAEQQGDVNHPLLRVLRQRPHWRTLAEALVVAVLIAPVVEEFLFRLVLQGWLEAWEARLRRRLGLQRFAEGLLPVFLTSGVFAALHWRGAQPPTDADALLRTFRCDAMAGVATLVFGVVCLRGLCAATLEDLGIRLAKIGSDIRLGLGAFVTVAAPVYGVQVVLSLVLPAILPEPIAPDPITLGLFALVLGTLYARTHRILPAITLHMALNATSVLLAWLTLPLVEG